MKNNGEERKRQPPSMSEKDLDILIKAHYKNKDIKDMKQLEDFAGKLGGDDGQSQ